MIFVDSNVFIYAVGRSHPLREEAQSFFVESKRQGSVLTTSAEVLQELLHVYLPVDRVETLDAALDLAEGTTHSIIPIDYECVLYARQLSEQYPSLTARDLLHLAVCYLHKIRKMKTFDRNLRAAAKKL